jgi:hypothetical protein
MQKVATAFGHVTRSCVEVLWSTATFQQSLWRWFCYSKCLPGIYAESPKLKEFDMRQFMKQQLSSCMSIWRV